MYIAQKRACIEIAQNKSIILLVVLGRVNKKCGRIVFVFDTARIFLFLFFQETLINSSHRALPS